MKKFLTRLAAGLTIFSAPMSTSVIAQAVTPEQIAAGSESYARHCATCHGNRMKNPEWAIDLATIPKDDRQRFIQSVTNGRGNMPPWGDVLKPPEIEALWAYFSQGEK